MPGSPQIHDRAVGADHRRRDQVTVDPATPQHRRDRPKFFGVATDSQSYLNIVYLLIALPLGTFYFVFLVTGISLGIGLIPLAFVGLPLLVGVVVASRTFMAFERTIAHALLGINMPPIAPVPAASGLKRKLTAVRQDRRTWSGLGYLLLKLPVGVATFTAAFTLLSVSVGFAFAPAHIWASDDLTLGDWTFDRYPWSFALVPVGIVLFIASLHVLNWAASLCGLWCRSWLTGPQIDLTDAD